MPANVKNHNVYALCSLLLVFRSSWSIIFLPIFFSVAPLLGALGALGPRFIEPPELPVPTPLGSSPIKLFLEICSNFLIFFYLSIKFSAGKFPEISGSTLLRLHTYAFNFIKIQRFLAERWKYIKFPKWRPSAALNFRNLPFWTRDV